VAVLLLAVGLRAVASQNLLLNGSFEDGTNDWQLAGEAQCDQTVARTGRTGRTGRTDDGWEVAAQQTATARRLGFDPDAEGNIAIFKDDIPPSGAPADPDELAEMLRQPGWRVGWLNSDQLADPQCLNRDNVDALVLPYGASFPVKAADNFRRFLRTGGGFVSVGGYAFDNLLERTQAGWRPPSTNPPPAVDHAMWHCEIPSAELRGRGKLTFSGFLKADHVTGPGMAYLAIYQTAADGSLPEWKDLCQIRGTRDWEQVRHTFTVHPQAAVVDLRAGLYRCSGVACFDDIRLSDEAGQVILVSDFEQEFDPDQRQPHCWSRSDPHLCAVQSRTRHSGQRALMAQLRYETPAPERLNTRFGIPADDLRVEPTQLGVFDADYPLERVRFARAAPGQRVVEPALRIEGPLAGYAASGVVGFDQARWVPLINGYDCYGRLRGAAGALLRHYAGPYAGSSWAFFGVTNRNLFSKSEPAMAAALQGIVRSIARNTWLISLSTDYACYRQGEPVRLQLAVFNGGRREARLQVGVEVYEGEPLEGLWRGPDGLSRNQASKGSPLSGTPAGRAKPVVTLTGALNLGPGRTNLTSLEWKPRQFSTDFYHLLGRLWDDGREVDCLEGGFTVWNDQVIAAGPPLAYRDNYLRLGNRPMFMFGTDDWGYVFNTARETPLQWLRDMRQRRDFGVQIYENLQFGLPPSPAEQEQLLRKVDGVTQLAQKHQQVYFPCLLVGCNVAASDAQLAQHKEFCQVFAQRYHRAPGLIYYLNGDLRCQLSDAVTPQWNEFLRDRYGTSAKLRAAWGQRAPAQQLGSIPAEDFNDWGQAWGEVKAYDLNCFRAFLTRRWCSALIAGIRQFDTQHPTTAEFYQLPHQGVDILAGIDGLDLCNFGYFDRPNVDLARFPAICKYNDQRARGKSVGPGEYGVKTHPAWGDGKDYGYHLTRTRGQAIELFLGLAHYSLGLGASRIHNWCWKDDAHRVFPWGMTYPCDNVPKDILSVHRNQSLLFRQFAPVYQTPSVYVLTADSHRLGGGKWQVIEGILKSIDLALASHVDNLGTLNEAGLDIPGPAKAIFYPLPFCPQDETYARVLNWVRGGGVLYVSGDISYDELRQRTRTRRLEELCGVRFAGELYPNIALDAGSGRDQPCVKVEPLGARVLKQTAEGLPLVLEHQVGAGRVIFSTDPLELRRVPERRAAELELYQSVLRAAGIRRLGVSPDDPLLHVFRVALRDGGCVYVVFNTDESQPARRVTLTDCQPPVTLTVASRRPGLVWRDGRGNLRAVESQGECCLDSAPLATDETDGIIFTLDGKDLADSRALVLMPLKAGVVRWGRTAPWLKAIVETGEIHNGSWEAFETASAPAHGPTLDIRVTSDQALSLVLVCDRGAEPRWRKAIERAMTHPASLP
jgi:hypothetical protein